MPGAGAGTGAEGGTGQSANAQLLRLVARANANVAELMRLSDFVPKIFYLEGDDARLYDLILQDYAYFQRADLVEEKLAVNPVSASTLTLHDIVSTTPTPAHCAWLTHAALSGPTRVSPRSRVATVLPGRTWRTATRR